MKTKLCLTGLSALALLIWPLTPAHGTPPASYCGMCDASAMAAIDDDLFIVADDEDSVMRIYSRQRSGAALYRVDLSTFLGFKPDDEADIEGSTRVGDRIYWITSHGTNRKGQEQESRQRFFAITTPQTNGTFTIQPVGQPYTNLLQDLLDEPQLAPFNLAAAAKLPPKAPGALNIEALASTREGHLLIGFRNPIPQGQALVVPLLNPAELLEGGRARFGHPQVLNLGGYGLRSLERWGDGYLIIAGSADGNGKSRLYEWSGGSDQARLMNRVDFEGLNPEAISVIEGNSGTEMLIVSDDGTRKVNGLECKRLKDPTQKTFRSVTVPLEPHMALKP